MNKPLAFAAALALAGAFASLPAGAQETAALGLRATDAEAAELTPVELWQEEPTRIFDAAEVVLEDFHWIARPLVVFADSPFDPNFQRQMDLLADRIGELAERDVVIVTDTDPEAQTPVRQQLRPRGFMMALVDKEGRVALRKPLPWDVRELSRSIDKMPVRQQEIRERRGLNR